MERTPLLQWSDRLEVSRATLARECKKVDSSVEIPAPHVSMYAHGRTLPTSKKAAILSAATFRIAAKHGCPDDGVTVQELLYPDGLPDGARIAPDGSLGDDSGATSHAKSNDDDSKAAAA